MQVLLRIYHQSNVFPPRTNSSSKQRSSAIHDLAITVSPTTSHITESGAKIPRCGAYAPNSIPSFVGLKPNPNTRLGRSAAWSAIPASIRTRMPLLESKSSTEIDAVSYLRITRWILSNEGPGLAKSEPSPMGFGVLPLWGSFAEFTTSLCRPTR